MFPKSSGFGGPDAAAGRGMIRFWRRTGEAAAATIRERPAETIALLLFAVLVSVVSAHHEVWRDEVRALSLVLEARSLPDFFRFMRNEGHPALWHFWLWLVHAVLQHPVALKVASLAVAIAAAWVLLFRSPFPWWQKVLAVFGVFPAYEYSVMCRNYGISMLGLFAFCALYPHRWRRPLALGMTVFLLAQTNAHAFIIAAALLAALLCDWFFTGRREPGVDSKAVWAAFLVMFAGLILSAWQMVPDRTTAVTPMWGLDHTAWLRAAVSALRNPGVYFWEAFGFGRLWVTVLIYAAAVYLLLKDKVLFLMFFPSVVGIAMLFQVVYYGAFRHQGMIYILLLSVYWLDLASPRAKTVENTGRIASHWMPLVLQGIVGFLLVVQVSMAYHKIAADIRGDLSSSKRLGQFLASDPVGKRAILLSEPDYLMESLPYYVPNPIYILRESRFGKVVSFTTRNRRELTLSELLSAAEALRQEQGRPVLVVIGHALNPGGPYTIEYGYGKRFVYSREMVEAFTAATRAVASFRIAPEDENYEVFRLLAPAEKSGHRGSAAENSAGR